MNVIEGQAGLIICASLIFYSLTIDNILNIIILLILAGVAINLAVDSDGLFGKTGQSANSWNEATAKEGNAVNSLIGYLYEMSRVTSDEKVVVTSDPVKGTYTTGNITVYLKYGENDGVLPAEFVLFFRLYCYQRSKLPSNKSEL